MIQRLASLPRCVSFQRHCIRQQLTDYADSIDQCHCVVDVGCGESVTYRGLFDHDVYVGLDRFERADVTADASALPLASEKADLILCTEVLEHLPKPRLALIEMNRALAPRGFLILTVPLIWGEHDYVDYQRWTEAGLRRILRSAGFEVQAIRRRGGIFAMLGCMITQVPHQVFGTRSDQRSWLSKMLHAFCWIITMPIPWVLALLDPLDHSRAFTVGYSALCQKNLTSLQQSDEDGLFDPQG